MTRRLIGLLAAGLPLACGAEVINVQVQGVDGAQRMRVIRIEPGRDTADAKIPSVPKTEKTEGIAYTDGDSICGKLLSIEPGRGLLEWGHHKVGEPVVFDTATLHDAWLKPSSTAAPTPCSACVTLTNGDMLAGDVALLDNTSLVLDTWYAGKITLQRGMVAGIEFMHENGKSFLYQGPKDGEEWHIFSPWGGQQGKLMPRNGALEFTGTKTRGSGGMAMHEIEKMPPCMRLDFEVEWTAARPTFAVGFCNGKDGRSGGKIMFGDGLMLYASQNNGQGYNEQRGNDWRGYLRSKNIKRARFSVLVDGPKRRCAVLVNSRLAGEWKGFPEGAMSKGNGLMFGSMAENMYGNEVRTDGTLRFQNIRVSAWDGILPTDRNLGVAAETDFLSFANGDGLSGELLGIKDGHVRLKSSYGEMDIPLARVVRASPAIHGKAPPTPRREKSDVRALLCDSWSSVTVKLERLDGKTLAGSSENFGTVAIARAAIERLEFNLYDESKLTTPKVAAKSSDDESDGGDDSGHGEDGDAGEIDVDVPAGMEN